MNICAHCGKETKNPKYCSKSCSAIESNTRFPKRTKITRYCKVCGKILDPYLVTNRAYLCPAHNMNVVDWSKVTYASITAKRSYQIHSRIRDLARSNLKRLKMLDKCQICGYTKHVEVHHKKAINSFPPTAFISEINSLDNLMVLCPNCHWEYDSQG